MNRLRKLVVKNVGVIVAQDREGMLSLMRYHMRVGNTVSMYVLDYKYGWCREL